MFDFLENSWKSSTKITFIKYAHGAIHRKIKQANQVKIEEGEGEGVDYSTTFSTPLPHENSGNEDVGGSGFQMPGDDNYPSDFFGGSASFYDSFTF